LPNVVTPGSKLQPQSTSRLVTQWIQSHSPMKCSGSPLKSSVSLLRGIQDHNYIYRTFISATVAEFESHLPNVVTPSSKPWPQGTFGLVAQWIQSHSPMKHSEFSLESSVSFLRVIQACNSIYRTFRTCLKVLLLWAQYHGSYCSCRV